MFGSFCSGGRIARLGKDTIKLVSEAADRGPHLAGRSRAYRCSYSGLILKRQKQGKREKRKEKREKKQKKESMLSYVHTS